MFSDMIAVGLAGTLGIKFNLMQFFALSKLVCELASISLIVPAVDSKHEVI